MITRPLRRGGLTAAAATLLLAGPAGAHPFLEPDEVPVDSLAEVSLDLAHGCGAEDAGGHAHDDGVDGEEPTREVAIEVPAAVSWVDPAGADGWDLEVEGGADPAGDASGDVIVYTAQEGTDEPAPRFDLAVVHRGEVGDEVHWRVMQACDDATHRWVGTEEEPAADPAITVTLVEADPDAPPPPDEDDEVVDDDPLAEEPMDEPDDGAGPDGPVDEREAGDARDLVADGDDDGMMAGWLLIVVLLAALGIAGLVLLLRGREDGADQGSGSTRDQAR